MHTSTLTETLTLPFLPERRRRVAKLRTWFSLPNLRPAEGSVRSAQRAERRLRRQARRGRRIVLGSAAQPYQPLALGGAPLRTLRQFEGLEITITTGSCEILEQLGLLVELDRLHAVAVDVLVAPLDPRDPDLKERLGAVSTLSGQGIATRLVLTDLPRFAAGNAGRLRQLFESAREVCAFDVAVALRHGRAAEPWRRLIRHLRFELGFPRAVPGRG